MKKIYTFLALAVFAGFSATAQRSIDGELIATYPTGGIVAINPTQAPMPASDPNDIQYQFKNNGPDNFLIDDTLILRIPAANYERRITAVQIGGIAPGNSGYIMVADLVFYKNTSGIPANPGNVQLCDSFYMVDINSVVIPDPSLTNNKSCNNVAVSFYTSVGIADVNTMQGFSLYPNPAVTTLNLVTEFNQVGTASVVIHDMYGKTVLMQELGKNLNGKKTFGFDIGNLANGLYVVELIADGDKITRQMHVSR